MIPTVQDKRDLKRADGFGENILLELQDSFGKADGHGRIVPVCSYCRKIRDNTGHWHGTEIYDHSHPHYRFSHGLCPACEKDLYLQLSEGRHLAVINQ